MQIANLIQRCLRQTSICNSKFAICNLFSLCIVAFFPVCALAEDVLELTSGAKVRGTILSRTDKEIQIEMVVSGKSLTRKFPLKSITAIDRDGKREELSATADP